LPSGLLTLFLSFDRVVNLAPGPVCVPMVLVSARVKIAPWFKAAAGLSGLRRGRRFVAFCAAILGQDVFVVLRYSDEG